MVKCPFFQRQHPVVRPEFSVCIQNAPSCKVSDWLYSFFQASIVFQSHSKAVFMVKCPHFSRGHATTPCRVGRYVRPSVTFLNSEQFLPRGSNPSLEAQIPTSKLKSLPQSSNPSLKAQIPASKLKSQHPGPIPASRP